LYLFLIHRKKVVKFSLLFLSSMLFVYFSAIFVTPGVEKITQRTAIDFIREQSAKDAYIHSFHKTYAVLFYGNIPKPEQEDVFSTEWLTRGEIDKDVYFVLRANDKEKILSEYSEVIVLYEKNGFVFCKRAAKINHDQ